MGQANKANPKPPALGAGAAAKPSPKVPCPRKVVTINAKVPTSGSARGTGAVPPPQTHHRFSSSSTDKTLAANAPTVLVRNCGPIDLEAVTDPPNQADVAWAIVNNPGPAAPTLTPNGIKASLQTNAVGGYSISATLDGTTVYWNLVLIGITVKSTSMLRKSDQFKDTSNADYVGCSSGEFDVANAAVCAMWANAKVSLDAGGDASLDTYMDKVHLGFPQNLLLDNVGALYQNNGCERERIVAPPKPADDPVVDPAVHLVDLGYPILDRGGDEASRATGGDTIFLSRTTETPDTGKDREVATCDSPAVGFDAKLPEKGKAATHKAIAISGVNKFKLYLAAYSDDANYTYVALGHAIWVADYLGPIERSAGTPTWKKGKAQIRGARALTPIADGQEAKAAGCEVRPPVFLDYVLDAR